MKFILVSKRKMFRLAATALVAAGVAEVAFPTTCEATDGPMVCAWRRTFWAQDGLKSPLRGYYMPRRPNCDCWGGSYEMSQSAAVACDGLGSVEFVRLGQLPNDLQVGVPVAPPSGR